MKSTRSDLLKHAPVICEHCNSTLTQPYDLAWEQLSEALLGQPVRAGKVIRANRLIPIDTHRVLLGAHLFLVKKLGCNLAEHGRFDDTIHLSKALQTGRACPYIYLTLSPPRMDGPYIAGGETDLEVIVDRTSGEMHRASGTYTNASATFGIFYVREGTAGKLDRRLWHPRQHTSRFEVIERGEAVDG